jgi:hypothetical protein
VFVYKGLGFLKKKLVPTGTDFIVVIFLLSRRCARKRRNKEFEETRRRDSERIPYPRNEVTVTSSQFSQLNIGSKDTLNNLWNKSLVREKNLQIVQ